jgi:uncharacterized membrane protein YsdA (DUF1294 family)
MEEINSIFTTQNILIYILIINVITFFMMWFDKHEAKIGDWRVPERTLFLLVLLGGGIGGIAGMYVFRHKTRKWYFKIGFPAILIMQIVLVIYLKKFI